MKRSEDRQRDVAARGKGIQACRKSALTERGYNFRESDGLAVQLQPPAAHGMEYRHYCLSGIDPGE